MKRPGSPSDYRQDYSKRRMTKGTDGDKSWKWDHYFGQLNPEIRGRIEMDSVSLFSTTIDRDADKITDIILNYIPSFAHVCDATACTGGNTMSFAKSFEHVTSIEMDPGRCQMLANNVQLVGLGDRVQTVNDDFMHFQKNMPYFDCIFFDPPWGGEDYWREESIDMYLSEVSIGDIVRSLRGKTRYVGLKSPSNFMLKEFEEKIDAKPLESVRFTISAKKNTYWNFTFYELSSISCLDGRLLHMLPPTIDPRVTSKLKLNRECSWKCPSHEEVSFIAETIKSSNPSGIDVLVNLSALVGLQSISFIAHKISSQYVLCSQYTRELQNNLSSYLSTVDYAVPISYIYAKPQSLCREVPQEVQLMISKTTKTVLYIDIFSILDSMDAMWNGKQVMIDNQPIEYWLQRLVESSSRKKDQCVFALRVPQWMESRMVNAFSCFQLGVHQFEQKEPASSLCPPHITSLIILSPIYPPSIPNQLSTYWKPSPPSLLHRQLYSIISAVMGDRKDALTLFNKTCAEGTKSDEEIFAITHAEFLSCCHYQPTTPWTQALAQKVDRSIVRVYSNKMKYVDAVTPRGFRPQQIVCVGGVDAHLAHELVKMYNLQQPSQALVLGEGDRRAEEQRTDYTFARYPAVQEGEDWQAYQGRLQRWAKEQLDVVRDVDMVVICCAHDIPFLGTLLQELIHHMSDYSMVILNDHSIETQQDRILLDVVHNFHRQVTCTHVLPLLDRQSINAHTTLDEEDKCMYLTKEEWSKRFSEYGFKRVEDERSAPYWSVSDPSNLLRYVFC